MEKEKGESVNEIDLKELEETYCKAAVALRTYQRTNGYNPGVRVVTRYGDKAPEAGVIAPYGDMWSRVDSLHIPVIFDDRLQPWQTSHLEVVHVS